MRLLSWPPRKEAGPFASQPSLRADVVLVAASLGPVHAIDCAIVHPAQARFRVAASTTAAGAATAYEATKRAKYGAFAAAERVKLLPTVVDVYGGFSASFLELIRILARPWGRRFDLAPCRSIPLVASRLNLVLMRSIARILLFTASPGDPVAPDAAAAPVEPAASTSAAAANTDSLAHSDHATASSAAPAADPLRSVYSTARAAPFVINASPRDAASAAAAAPVDRAAAHRAAPVDTPLLSDDAAAPAAAFIADSPLLFDD